MALGPPPAARADNPDRWAGLKAAGLNAVDEPADIILASSS